MNGKQLEAAVRGAEDPPLPRAAARRLVGRRELRAEGGHAGLAVPGAPEDEVDLLDRPQEVARPRIGRTPLARPSRPAIAPVPTGVRAARPGIPRSARTAASRRAASRSPGRGVHPRAIRDAGGPRQARRAPRAGPRTPGAPPPRPGALRGRAGSRGAARASRRPRGNRGSAPRRAPPSRGCGARGRARRGRDARATPPRPGGSRGGGREAAPSPAGPRRSPVRISRTTWRASTGSARRPRSLPIWWPAWSLCPRSARSSASRLADASLRPASASWRRPSCSASASRSCPSTRSVPSSASRTTRSPSRSRCSRSRTSRRIETRSPSCSSSSSRYSVVAYRSTGAPPASVSHVPATIRDGLRNCIAIRPAWLSTPPPVETIPAEW